MNFKTQPWQPSHAYKVGQEILDSNLHIQVVRTKGTSGATAPAPWNAAIDGSTTDGGVKWTNQGPNQASHAAWLPSHGYVVGNLILDTNGNVQWVHTAGTSGATAPATWNKAIAGATTDGGVNWRNVGPIATVSVAASGGTSGIIMDNIVGTGTLAGASQVYFSTQGNQACTGGTGGCAVQASQSGLN